MMLIINHLMCVARIKVGKIFIIIPEHYGWVVEVNPKDGSAQKHIVLGPFCP